MADQLVTLAQVKARVFPVGTVDAAEDTLLSELNDQATDFIQELTGRHFIPEVGVTYYVDTRAGSVIDIQRGVRAVTSLSIANSDQPDDGSGTYVAMTATDILLRPSTMDLRPGWPPTRILLRGTGVGRLVTAMNGAKIVGNFGFAAVPPAVQAIALDAIAAAYTAKAAGDSDAVGADGSPIPLWARMFSPGTAQRDTLDRYRGAVGIG